jgi:hypothetical protein
LRIGSFGCSVLSNWDPTGDNPPQWSIAPNGIDLQLTVQNGDTCQKTGMPRTITVNFICDPTAIAPASFVVTEPDTCNYAWDFPTSAVCGGLPINPNILPINIAARDFGCGHISCGWMFIILLVLILPLAYLGAFAVYAFALKKEGNERFPLTGVAPLFVDYAWWGFKFFAARCGSWGRATVFNERLGSWVNFHHRGEDAIAGRGSDGLDHGDYPSEGGSFQEHRSSSMYNDDDL